MDNISQQILEFLQTIPKWKVASYKSIAQKFNVHPRKVAAVMKYNKNPDIYPCYKVVAASGKVSGYSWYDGVSSKVDMLESDGIKIIDGMIDIKYMI